MPLNKLFKLLFGLMGMAQWIELPGALALREVEVTIHLTMAVGDRAGCAAGSSLLHISPFLISKTNKNCSRLFGVENSARS